MLIWGSHRKIIETGESGSTVCPVCKEQQPYTSFLSYKVSHIWYLVRWSTQQQYHRRCANCHNLFDVDAPVAVDALSGASSKPRSPIPFFDRWGWALGMGLLVVLIVSVMIGEKRSNAHEDQLLAAPQAGDLYVVKVERFLSDAVSQSAGSDYGVFRLMEVSEGNAILAAPKVVYSGRTGATNAVRDGLADNEAYYEGYVIKPLADMRTLHDSDVIVEVKRR